MPKPIPEDVKELLRLYNIDINNMSKEDHKVVGHYLIHRKVSNIGGWFRRKKKK